jgi:lysozyme family protein
MAEFEPAFAFMIPHEDYNLTGVVTDEPGGGQARFGINSIAHPEAVTDGFFTMSRDAALAYAKDVYQRDYWNGRGLAAIANQQVASKLFDMAVNMGYGGMLGVLQRTLSVPITHSMDAATKQGLALIGDAFLDVLVKNLKDFYQAIHDRNPQKYDKILSGWMARANQLPPAPEV